MTCFSELDYSIYVDGESPRETSQLIRTHLRSCERCRVLVDVLRSEGVLLSLMVGSHEESEVAAPASRGSVWWGVAALFAIAASWQAVAAWLETIELPAAVGWLNPLTADFWWNVGSGALFSMSELPAPNPALLGAMAAIAGLAVVVAGMWFMRRWLPGALLPAMSLLFLFAMLSPANALERRKEHFVTIARGETVNDSLLVMAQDAAVDGVINGDLFVFGRRVTINGSVKGDVISFSRNLEVNGKVEGNIYNFAQSLRIEGEAARSVTSFAQTTELPSQGRVGADLIAFTEQATLEGSVQRDVVTFSEATTVRGKIGRNLRTYGDHITLVAPAQISGDFIAQVRKRDRAQVGDGVTIGGKTDIRIKVVRSRYSRPSFYIWKAITLIGAWLVGMLLIAFFPAALGFIPRNGSELGWRAAVGCLVLLLVPVAIIVLAVTLVGLPLALITFCLWILALYLAKIFVAATAAHILFKPTANTLREMAAPLLGSLLLVWIVVNLPYVGGLLNFLLVLVGAGIVFTWWRARLAPPAAVSS